MKSTAELFQWGPIDARPVYAAFFHQAIGKLFKKECKVHWPEHHCLYRRGKVTYFHYLDEGINVGKNVFHSKILNDKQLKKSFTEYKKNIATLQKIYKQIDKSKEPAKLYLKFHSAYLKFWGNALIPEIANFGVEGILKEEIEKLNLKESEEIKLIEKLSSPEKLSFYQQEELDLVSCKTKDDFQKHAKKYFWIGNSYYDQKVLDATHFEKEKKRIKKTAKEILTLPKKAKQSKQSLFKKYKTINRKMINRLRYSIWWQDDRKKHIFIANHYIKMLLQAVAKEKKVPLSQIVQYDPEELLKLVKTNKKINLTKRKEGLVYHHKTKLTLTNGAQAKKRFDKLIKRTHNSTIKGMVVSQGKGSVSGKVKILLTPRNIHKMKQGEILVTTMTSPDFIVAMRKAKAIITDVGGMTCHAAIVSRELGIPCIVGTKSATSLLKNGNNVAINVKNGEVKIKKR